VKRPYGPDEFARDTGVSRETLGRLEAYVALLHRWNEKINLIGRGTAGEIWWRHVLDSAQLFALIPEPHKTLVDMGSGAGFPGLVLAAMGTSSAHLIEGDQRKAVFLREAARVMELPVTVHAARIEAVEGLRAATVTARALAPLPELLALTERFCQPETVHVYPKGQNMEGELTATHKIWTMRVEQFESRTDPAACILRLREVRRVRTEPDPAA
jgi:16S rRNA (guanine527-N7)-methyltransferase